MAAGPETVSLYSYVEFIIHALYAMNMLDIYE
jgi:hypothetical protein